MTKHQSPTTGALDDLKRRIIAAFDHQSEVDADFFTTGEDRYDPANDPEAEPGDAASHTYGVEGYVDLDALAGAIYSEALSRPSPIAEPQDSDAAGIPREIAEQVLSMGKVEWGATDEFDDAGHLAHLAESLRITREHFNFDCPVAMHGLYLEGTETVLCHTGTSPNSGTNAQALAGAWNWLHDQCAARLEAPIAEDALVGRLREALEPFALLAGGDVNMNDPLSKWFRVHHLQEAADALGKKV